MASFSIIPYLGPPTKPPRSFNKSKVTVEKEQGGSPLQDTYQVCPGENPNRSQLVCSFRSSMESTEPSEWGAAQHATENESVIRLTQSSPSSRDQCLLRVEDSAQLNHKDDLDYSDWVCSSRSSTISTELSESGKTQQADQSETCPLSQVSENPQQRQFAVASAKTKQQRKRKASIADLILDGKGDQERSSIESVDLCSYDNLTTVRKLTVKPEVDLASSSHQSPYKRRTGCKKKPDSNWITRHEEKLNTEGGELATSVDDSLGTDSCHDLSLPRPSSKVGRSPDQPILIQEDADNACLEFDYGDEWVVKQIKSHRSTTSGLEFKVACEDKWVREEDLGTAWKLLRQYREKPVRPQHKRSRRVVKGCKSTEASG